MTESRRDFLKSCGALIVSFSSGPLSLLPLQAPGPFGTHPSHIDPEKLDSWLAVGDDGIITAYTGKCDFGQGIFTVQSQLVAEELCVRIARVKLIQCDTSVCPDQGTTSGSQSTPTNFNSENLALAAASAREALLSLAAKKLGEPVEHLTVADGVITGTMGRHVKYEELTGNKHFELPLNVKAKRKSVADWTVLGKPIPSLDRTALMAGQFEFVHNVQVPGMLHGRVVRPPEMGATVAHVDEQSVRNIQGLVKVVVRKDFVGVVAETQYHATLAARQLAVRWNPGPELPPQKDFFNHIQKLPSRDALNVDSQDVEARLAEASSVIRARYTYPYQMHGSVGASCAVADVKADSATVWSATQSAYPTRSIVAKLLNMPLEKVRVIYVRGSGCYGLNGADAVSFDAAILSQAVGKPVRLQFSRRDEMMWENLGSACTIQLRAGLAQDGHVVAWDREDWVAAMGNRPGYDQPGNVITGMLLGYEPELPKPGPAKPPSGEFHNRSNTVPSYFAGCIAGSCGGDGTIRSERALTHTVRSPFFTGPLRSPLRIQNTFANECFMDELCAHANVDPVAFRLMHLQNSRVIGVVKAAAQATNWQARPSPKTGISRTGTVSGRGIACVAYEGNNGYAALVAEVEVDLETGTVRPRRFVVALDCGPISNPDGLRNQIEGGILQGMSRALVEEVTWDSKRVTSIDWETYNSLYLDYEMPTVETVFVTPPDVPATGAGETAITVIPAAIGNAIFDATGVRLREVPFTPQRVKAALAEGAQRGGSV
ncbi:MAG TPA: molybdopterin cofactor-binding domain-containing protein [Candidatus Acidoferrales bacterium]